METLLYSELNPIPFFDTSLAKIKSQCLSFNLINEFLFKFWVSAEKPATIRGLFLLFLDINSNISRFLIKLIDFKFREFFLILFLFFIYFILFFLFFCVDLSPSGFD